MGHWIDNWFSSYRPYHTPLEYGTVAHPLTGVETPLIFRCPETFFHAMKTHDPGLRLDIAQMPPPQAKRAGRRLVLRPDWESIKLDVMAYAQRWKFQPGTPEFDRLMATPEPIVEWTNWHDLFWGRCVCPKHQSAGENHLGRIITAIREEHL